MPSRSLLFGIGVVSLSAIGIAFGAERLGSNGLPVRGPAGRDGRDGAVTRSVTLTVPSTTSGTTTTMPPRADPALFAPIASGVLDGRVIVVDPGHNGRNFEFADVRRPGSDGAAGPLCNTAGSATSSGVREVDVNWAIGTRLAELLRRHGAAVVMTHADNAGFGPCADERGRLAQTADADVLISIHADGAPPSASGFHLIHPAPHPLLRVDTIAASKRFAAVIRDELIVIGGRPATYVGERGVQERGDLGNLNNADRPSVLAELGNLRNPLDATLLSDRAGYELLARALARATVRFLGTVPPAALSADLDSNGLVDLLAGAPAWMMPTTSTTTTATSAPDPALATGPVPSSSPGESSLDSTGSIATTLPSSTSSTSTTTHSSGV